MRALGLGVGAWPTLMLLASLATADAARAHWTIDAEAGIAYDNNVGNAGPRDDRLGERLTTAALAATQTRYLDEGAGLSWGGRLAAESHARYSGLDNLALGGSLAYRKKLDLGPYAPWWRASWTSSALAYGDHARNGWLHQAELAAGKRFDPRWNLAANLCLERRSARSQASELPGMSGDVYSQLSRSLGLNAEYAASRGLVLSLGGQLRHGDVVSTSHRYRQIFLVTKAIADDDALGPERYAYRLGGTSYLLNASLALALSPAMHLTLGLQRALTHGDGNNNYGRNLLSVAWNGNF